MTPVQLGNLVEEHAAALVLYARQWCAEPEDVVQDAFIKLMRQQPPPSPPLPWLYRVVRNAAIDRDRAVRRRRQHETEAASQTTLWFAPVPGTALDAQSATDALTGLQPEQREAVVAHLWGGLTFEQIGELMGMSSSAAHRHYHAGLVSLRERLNVPCPPRTTPTS